MRRVFAAVALGGVPCVAAALSAFALVLTLVGRPPAAGVRNLNLAEAAALRDAGEVARLIEEGENPNGRYRVGAGILSGRSRDLTPLEAARAARRPEIEELLVTLGATR